MLIKQDMDYNIYNIPQVEISGSLIPDRPYFITEGSVNDKVVDYFYTKEEAQIYLNNL
jgi:hypothetical protein